LYVNVREAGSIYYFGEAEYKRGEHFEGGGFRAIPGEETWGAVRAYKPATGELAWEHKVFSPPYSGLLSTAGNLVFGATPEGQFFALDSRTGKPLYRFQAGGLIRSNPISYLSGGKQYVAMPLGNTLYVFGLE
jgi:alcohol dehydrogenase (cytochrome c)